MLPPEIPIPSNPNAVVFATDAARLFHERSWPAMQALAAKVALPVSESSGLPVLVGFAWRAMLDRKNRTQLQGLLYAMMDGPLTREQLAALELSVEDLDLGFCAPCIERMPPTAAHAVLAAEGRSYGLLFWEEGGNPAIRALSLEGGRVVASHTPVEDTTDGTIGELPHAIAIPSPYGPEEQESERMRLSYALGITERIIAADGKVDPEETAWVVELFPPDLLARLGLSDPAVRAEYFEAARTTLPSSLGHHDKLALVGLFFSACFSDGRVDAREMRVLKDAAEQLGLTKEEVVKYLQRFW